MPETQKRPTITCPRCGRTSAHPDDIREGYCGNCHDWTSPPKREEP
jgi:ribosomal protein L37E